MAGVNVYTMNVYCTCLFVCRREGGRACWEIGSSASDSSGCKREGVSIKRHQQKLISMMLTPSEQAAGEFTPKMMMTAVVVRSCGHSRATSITVQNKQVHWRGNDIDIEEQQLGARQLHSHAGCIHGSRLKGQSPIWLMETRQNASGGRCAHIDRQVTFQSLGQEKILVVQLAWQRRIDANS